MTSHDKDEDDIDATAEQLAILREHGISDDELHELTFSEAQERIDELNTMRQDAGKIGRE